MVNPDERRVAFEVIGTGAKRANTIIPRLRGASLIRSFTGYTVWTPHLLPVVGTIPQYSGLSIAADFCGLGFAIGPGIGKLMAELVTTGEPSLPLDAYRVDRFNKQITTEEA